MVLRRAGAQRWSSASSLPVDHRWSSDDDDTAGVPAVGSPLAAIVVTAIWLVVRYLKWITTNFVITSDRLIFRHGVVAKSGIEIPLERVNNVNFNQGIFERMLGAGDLLIESGGEDGQSASPTSATPTACRT